jgi:uncharacterized protein (DUF1697 family)
VPQERQQILRFCEARGSAPAVPRFLLIASANATEAPVPTASPQAQTSVRYAALLRGVSPMNAKMPALKAAFESAGFTDVRTVLSSGNVLFNAPPATEHALESRAEAAMLRELGRSFYTIVRSVESLRALCDSDPWQHLHVPAGAKRVVTFSRTPPRSGGTLPVTADGVCIHQCIEREILTSYLPHPKGPVFMTMLQKRYGDEVTTRTWDTVKRLAV